MRTTNHKEYERLRLQTKIGKEGHNKTCRRYRRDMKEEVYKLLGNKCSNPFNIGHGTFLTDIRCLQIDHINGGGSHQKTHGPVYSVILREIKAGSKEYQLLCANCNWIKRHEKGENGNHVSI